MLRTYKYDKDTFRHPNKEPSNAHIFALVTLTYRQGSYNDMTCY